jgi:arylsulfatase A-like enzyme
MNLRSSILYLALGLACALPRLHASPPNVIVIMTDDQGYGDLSCHGNPLVQTPHLDRIHGESVRLTDFHVAPMCTPTRGQLMTGCDAARNGATNVSSGRSLLRREFPTLADVFAKAGYATGMFGKWHLGDTYPYRPQDRGFHESLWFPSSHINSVPDVWDNDYFDDTYRRGATLEKQSGYCTDVFFREAIAWIKTHRAAANDRPFFLYLPTNAPHAPYWLPKQDRAAMTRRMAEVEASGTFHVDLPPPQKRDLIAFLAMIQNIDDNVGRLDACLRQEGLFENTLLVFLTDNGSTMGHAYFPAGMRGHKTQLWEGGHRVPCFIRHPQGGLGQPRDVAGLTQVQDLLPTLASLSGISDLPPHDGLDLAPILRGSGSVPADRHLIINYSRMPISASKPLPNAASLMRREGAAVLWRHWRLLEDRELYDLQTDPLQQRNVIDDNPDIAARMREFLADWWADVAETVNEPQPVVIGHDAENPVLLTACEWVDVFVDQQKQVRQGQLKNGWWELEVANAGHYEFELRRWPADADLPLTAGLPATEVTDGVLEPGNPLPIAAARLRIGTSPPKHQPLKPGAKAAVFRSELPAGRTRLQTWFDNAGGEPLVGAFYLKVTRLGRGKGRGKGAEKGTQLISRRISRRKAAAQKCAQK